MEDSYHVEQVVESVSNLHTAIEGERLTAEQVNQLADVIATLAEMLRDNAPE